ncbi:potassium-transporting ATPase subunit F [Acidithiobacillus sp. CV18-2]|nr:potassium-transporting ATPase subunit F [Acidithiobacillus sp. CV18-3]MBU2757985.1 potassium-transporting ATPase subunit F [Acidithiobacillus sp. BN09-2]MBU2776641.1 potassium-transporting ATPase subunit F [Acidithiobacillus sp. CV18-2]MBU2798654.1 potassium-transporting ATPase subunit F [Acidithiobacillus sp. VAN18-4]UTV82061.1 potassium-transporting ATPase subunit F [Acidithiobacillus sp. YTS05]
MTLFLWISLGLGAAVFVYLLAFLLFPERFL